MMSIYGFNVLSMQDRTKFYAHARALNPAAMLFYSQMGGTAAEFAAAFPNCATILRNWPDDKIHKQETPEAWLNRVSVGVPESVYLYTTNEVGFSSELIKWHVDLMKLAVQRKRRLCILNMGAGQPQPDDWKSAKELVTLASQHDDLFIIGLHQYAGGVITSGLIGGDPAHVQPNTWPTPAETKGMTRWHVGRQKFLYDQCKTWGIAPPRVVISEAGFDYLGDIGQWLNKLEFTPPNNSINGWHTLIKQWRAWWPTWDAETAYAKQMQWAANTLWNDVEAVLLFGYGDSGGWSAYDVSRAETLIAQLASAEPVPIPEPPPPTPPSDATVPSELGVPVNVTITGDNWYMRSEPNASAAQIGKLTEGEFVRLYPATATLADGQSYKVVKRITPVAGEANLAWTAFPTPPIVLPPPPSSNAEGDLRLVAAKESMIQTLETEIAVLRGEIREILSHWYTSMAA